MSNKKTLEQMSTTEAKRMGITSLADRPNDASRYGDGGLTAEMLKARFDALPNLVREKFNKIAEMLASTDAAKYITLGGEDNALGETLFDFLALFGPRGDGITDKNISDLIETLYQGEGDEAASSRTLREIVASICARLVGLRNFAGGAVGTFNLWVDEEGQMIVDAIDLTGNAFMLYAIDPIGKAGIRDGAVGFEKLDSELGGRVSRAFAKVRYTASDGKLHFDSADGVELDSIDLPLESIIVNGAFDTSTKDLVFTLVGGGTLRIPFDAYIEAVASDVARLNAKTDKSFKTAALVGDSTLVFETHDGSASTVDLSTVALDGQTRDTIARLEKNDADHERRIANIEEHISDDYFVTDETVAYEKAVPARACSSAKLLSLGGMTHKCKNLLDSTTINFVGNATVTNGVATQTKADTNPSPYMKCLTFDENDFIAQTIAGTIQIGRLGVAFEKTSEIKRISFGLNGSTTDTMVGTDVTHLPNGTYYLSVNFTNIAQGSISWRDMMINEGSTALPYEPFYEGLRDSKVTEIVSRDTEGNAISTYPIPAEIQAIEGYGKDGFNIDLEKQEYTYGGVTSALPARLEPIIKVEGGGSLEFVNEYKNPVPSAVKYLLKEESAV
jgi:hypothetical protein